MDAGGFFVDLAAFARSGFDFARCASIISVLLTWSTIILSFPTNEPVARVTSEGGDAGTDSSRAPGDGEDDGGAYVGGSTDGGGD